MLTNPLSARDLAKDSALLEALQPLLSCLSQEPSGLPGEGTQDLSPGLAKTTPLRRPWCREAAERMWGHFTHPCIYTPPLATISRFSESMISVSVWGVFFFPKIPHVSEIMQYLSLSYFTQHNVLTVVKNNKIKSLLYTHPFDT